MASISSLTGTSSTSSIYGNRNVLSGLASGMDTESMIENAVSGIKTKISALQQKRTKVEWQQEGYRSIISKMVDFNRKYTSYNSQTNLFSNSFFNNAVSTVTNGANAGKVSASGKTSSDVAINGVRQLASAARYTVSGGLLGGSTGIPTAVADEAINLGKEIDLSTISGTMTLQYGNQTIDLDFGETETFDSVGALAKAIEEKLDKQKITLSSGKQESASKLIGVQVSGDTISFRDTSDAGNSVYIRSASANIKETLGITTGGDTKQSSFTLSAGKSLKTQKNTSEYLADKTMNITLDGVTKSIGMPTQEELTAYHSAHAGADDKAAYTGVLQDKIDKAFGKNGTESKLKVGFQEAEDGAFKFQFTANKEGSTFSISSKVSKDMGFEKGLTSYLNTGRTLGDMHALDGLAADRYTDTSADGSKPYESVRQEEVNGDKTRYYYENENGKKVYTDENGNHVDANDKKLYSFQVNGVKVGQFTEDTALETVLTSINNNAEAGVKGSYSKITNQFVFTAKETGTGGRVEFGEGLAQKMFGGILDESTGELHDSDGNKIGSSSVGQDAIFSATINGQTIELTRGSNVVDMDGLTVTLKDTFGYQLDGDGNVQISTDPDHAGEGVLDGVSEKVTFTTTSDADTIVDAIKSMVEDYNAMVTEIKNAYSTMPAEKSNHGRYEPLTEEDMAEMSESSIKAYEEKAKQGILFADRDLSSLYSKLRSAVSSSGTDSAYLRGIGISTGYSDGLTTLSLDESKLRSALESDPDKVRDAFTKTKESGSATDGLMQNLKATVENYASPNGASKGILIQKAGSPLAPTSILKNSLKSIMDNYDKEIEKWQGKLSDKVDYYTSKFTQLEKLISEMNSQSSSLSGMMGSSY